MSIFLNFSYFDKVVYYLLKSKGLNSRNFGNSADFLGVEIVATFLLTCEINLGLVLIA